MDIRVSSLNSEFVHSQLEEPLQVELWFSNSPWRVNKEQSPYVNAVELEILTCDKSTIIFKITAAKEFDLERRVNNITL